MPEITDFNLDQRNGGWTAEYSDGTVKTGNVASAVAGDGKFLPAATLASRQAASCISLATYAHAVASRVDQPTWVDLSSWVTQATPGLQISGGRLYSTGVGASNSAAQRGLSIPAGGSLRAVLRVNLKAAASDRLGVCINTQAAGAVPAAGMANCVGLYVAGSGISPWAGSAGAQIGSVTAGDYTVVVLVTATQISISMRKDDGSVDVGSTWSRSTYAANNFQIFSSDSAGLAGVSIGAIHLATSPVSQCPSTPVDAAYATSHVFSTLDASVNYRVWLPAGFDSRRAVPLVMLFHGNGTAAADWLTNGNMSAMLNAVLARGWIAMSVDLAANRSTWGAAAGTGAYKTAFAAFRGMFPFSSLVAYANSMGGIESLNAIYAGDVPVPAAWIASAPTYSLASCYSWGTNNFAGLIRNAYGVAADGSDYEQKTASRDPALNGKGHFAGMPVMAIVPTDDVAIDPVANGLALISDMSASAFEVASVRVTGGHSSGVAPYTTVLLDFAAKHAGL